MPNIYAHEIRETDVLKVESVRDICAYYLGLDSLTPERRQEKEEAWGYKSKCSRLLQKLCGVTRPAINNWGPGLEFGRIPPIRLAQLTILFLRAKLEKAQQELRQRDERIQQLQRKVEALQFKLQNANARKSA